MLFLKAQNQHLRSSNKSLKKRIRSLSSKKDEEAAKGADSDADFEQYDEPRGSEGEKGKEAVVVDDAESVDSQEVLFVTSAVKRHVQNQQRRFEDEIVAL